MNLKIFATAVALAIGTAVPANAQESPSDTSPQSNQVLDACIRNQAETLPVPFSDVSPNHWAFKAVMTMHYCGAFRQATPPTLLQRQPTQSQQAPQSVNSEQSSVIRLK